MGKITTTVFHTRSEKERKKQGFFGSSPKEIRQKISNCTKCPKPAEKGREHKAKYTSSQFWNEKLQKVVDSVDCLWYSKYKSCNNLMVGGGNPPIWFGYPDDDFVECGENEGNA